VRSVIAVLLVTDDGDEKNNGAITERPPHTLSRTRNPRENRLRLWLALQ